MNSLTTWCKPYSIESNHKITATNATAGYYLGRLLFWALPSVVWLIGWWFYIDIGLVAVVSFALCWAGVTCWLFMPTHFSGVIHLSPSGQVSLDGRHWLPLSKRSLATPLGTQLLLVNDEKSIESLFIYADQLTIAEQARLRRHLLMALNHTVVRH